MPIQIYEDGKLPTENYGRVLVFGPTGAGKTTLGSTMPGRRFVLAADPNAGAPLARTLAEVPRIYTPKGATDRKPAVLIRVSTWSEAEQAVSWLEQNQGKKELYSVVVDSLTALAEMCQQELLGASGKAAMSLTKGLSKQDFGAVFMRLDGLRHRLHKLPAHVLWLCGVKSVSTRPDDDKAPRLMVPDLIGQSAERFPANCMASLFIERRRNICQLRTRPDDEVNAKDNTGLLPPVVHADMEPILFKMGFGHPTVMDYSALRVCVQSSFSSVPTPPTSTGTAGNKSTGTSGKPAAPPPKK